MSPRSTRTSLAVLAAAVVLAAAACSSGGSDGSAGSTTTTGRSAASTTTTTTTPSTTTVAAGVTGPLRTSDFPGGWSATPFSPTPDDPVPGCAPKFATGGAAERIVNSDVFSQGDLSKVKGASISMVAARFATPAEATEAARSAGLPATISCLDGVLKRLATRHWPGSTITGGLQPLPNPGTPTVAGVTGSYTVTLQNSDTGIPLRLEVRGIAVGRWSGFVRAMSFGDGPDLALIDTLATAAAGRLR